LFAEESEAGGRMKKKKMEKGPRGERRNILPNQNSHWERG
jgi:hypothetical protein